MEEARAKNGALQNINKDEKDYEFSSWKYFTVFAQ